ncbi:Pentatricopeptide repeat superfamily protein [Prunus dulcis]|uniref:Pentatricopeptide repeat superfamily protein n=1 Tax=Prunus dulcis TaxID=3755 RepID=A0A4Y1QNY7_PRUDU|nr:Pentatricopeptide repeat superfamily protein [Prunus dulcis]
MDRGITLYWELRVDETAIWEIPTSWVLLIAIRAIQKGNPLLGSTQFHWLSIGHDLCLSKVLVAADYSDSVPDSSSYITNQGYHPLEEVKVCKMVRDTKLTSAEIARTTVEANCSALLVFPGKIHCEPHEQISWADFEYVIDDYGDLYFEIFDDANLLEDPAASNPVNALFGMDIPTYDDGRIAGEFNILGGGNSDEIPFDDDYLENMTVSLLFEIGFGGSTNIDGITVIRPEIGKDGKKYEKYAKEIPSLILMLLRDLGLEIISKEILSR